MQVGVFNLLQNRTGFLAEYGQLFTLRLVDQLSNFKQFIELNILESFSRECGQEAIQDMLCIYKDMYLLGGRSRELNAAFSGMSQGSIYHSVSLIRKRYWPFGASSEYNVECSISDVMVTSLSLI